MNSVIEKEKKLNLALTKLKNLNLKNPSVKKNIENLSTQKNQLENEKQEERIYYWENDQKLDGSNARIGRRFTSLVGFNM